MRAHEGDCQGCFYGVWTGGMFPLPNPEPGAKTYFVMYLKDDEVQQLEQIWSP